MQHQHMYNRFMKTCFVLIILLSLGSHLRAQDAQSTITVDQAVATALQNNYDIQLSRNDSILAAINYDYRNYALLPTLNFNTTLLSNRNNQSQRFPDTTKQLKVQTASRNASFALNWTIFNGFKMFYTRNRLGRELELGSLTIKNQIVNSVSDVIKTYYDIVHQKQQLRNIEEQMTLSSDRLKLAQYRFDVGVGIKPDVLQAQIDFNQQRAARVNQLATIDQRKQDLNRLMNVPQNLNYDVIDTIPVQEDLTLGYLLGNLEQTSPQIQIAQKNIDIAKIQVKEARADYFPVIALTSNYNLSHTSNNTVFNAFQSLSNQVHGLNYGVTAVVPIFNGFAVHQNIRLAKQSVSFQELSLQNQQSQLNTNILNNFKTYDAQKQVVILSDSSIQLARENLNIERERYRLGATTFVELRQAEQSLADALNTQITARYNLKIAETELLRLKGDLLRR